MWSRRCQWGSLWFGPLFGHAWARHMGYDEDMQPEGMGKSMAIFAIGNLPIAFVLAHSIIV